MGSPSRWRCSPLCSRLSHLYVMTDQFSFLYRRLASLFFPVFQVQIDIQRLALGEAFWKRKIIVEMERRKKEKKKEAM